MTSGINLVPDFHIRTHHIKSLHAPVGQCYFLSSQTSMQLLQKSLCEQKKNTINQQNLNQQNHLLNRRKEKEIKSTSRELSTNIIVSEQDVNKLLTQIIQKGRKVECLFKQNSATNTLTPTKQEFQKYCFQNSYLKSTSQLILNEYFKKRKLGTKLRGLNSDLLIQIQNKLFNLIQAQFKIWTAKKESLKIQSDFSKKALEIQKFLHNLGQENLIS